LHTDLGIDLNSYCIDQPLESPTFRSFKPLYYFYIQNTQAKNSKGISGYKTILKYEKTAPKYREINTISISFVFLIFFFKILTGFGGRKTAFQNN
jgi:hypothetical protein